jgi:hypothetical protein
VAPTITASGAWLGAHPGSNRRNGRGRRRRLLRLQFLGLLQGVVDQAHSAWCAAAD